jgi:hypothetical protein
MRRVSILSIALLGGLVALGTSCSSGTNTPTGTTTDTGGSATGGGSNQQGGGQSGGNQSGGSSNQSGGSQNGGSPSGGNPSGGNPSGGNPSGGAGQTGGSTGESGGQSTGGAANPTGGTTGTQVGTTNPANAVQLPGDYYTSGTFKGYCYTYGDFTKSPAPTTPSNVSPPCGTTGPCFSAATGMCIAGSLGISTSADSYAAYGVGIGCALNQDQAVDGGSTTSNPVSVSSLTNVSLTVYGDKLSTAGYQVGVVSGGTTYCSIVSSASVTAGTAFTVPLSSLKTECWATTGTAFDPSTMQITNLQLQLQTGSATQPYDVCVSQFTIL